MRRAFQYPPYYYLALITITHPNQVVVVQSAQTDVSNNSENRPTRKR